MKGNSNIARKASHYNSWYIGPKQTLTEELQGYLDKANISDKKDNIRGMIVPHAGIMWSGATAAWGFKNLIDSSYKTLFIIGPSHFLNFEGCAYTTAEEWETPYGNLKVDTEIIDILKEKCSLFKKLPLKLDEYEHSLELQTPYLGYIYQCKLDKVKIVPILTGKMSLEDEKELARILLPYYLSDESVFIISEDFCHWGPRHDFWFLDEKLGEIYKSIEYLDNLAFETIKSQNAKSFKEYLTSSTNNLCGGGSPITVFVSLMEIAKQTQDNAIEFVHYTKSNPMINDKEEESVSYAVGLNYKSLS